MYLLQYGQYFFIFDCMSLPKIGVIGCGIMGSAIINGLLKKNIANAQNIMGCDVSEDRLEQMRTEIGIQTTTSNDELINNCDIVLLAIKPQYSDPVFDAIKGKVQKTVLISIMAGITIEKIQNATEAQNVIRVMPNTPAQISEGVSGWYASESVSEEQKEHCQTILKAIGTAYEVETEDMIDSVTAITGSGPAYVFYFAEHIIEHAKKLGIEETHAKQMVKELFLGAVHLWDQSDEEVATLRKNVTSPGGTTEAALGVMNEKMVPEIISAMMDRCKERAKELSN